MSPIKKEEFRKTEIGLIHRDWRVARLGDYIERIEDKNKENEQYPVYSVSNIYGFVLSVLY